MHKVRKIKIFYQYNPYAFYRQNRSEIGARSDYPSFRPILHKKLFLYRYNVDFTLNEYAKITCSNTISYILLKMYFSTITATPSSSLLSVTSSAISKTCF